MTLRRLVLASLVVLLIRGIGPGPAAATPPALVNYQGVLRNSLDAPLSGTFDMIFRFYSADVGGDAILEDSHTAAGTNPVTATNGVFSVQLGSGSIADLAGPGTYLSLDAVFRDYAAVYLDITVGGELLTPRVRVVAAAYALNATNLAGSPASAFLDTGAAHQSKGGGLTLNTADSSTFGVVSYGTLAGGYFLDSTKSGFAWVGKGDYGIYAGGNTTGGFFLDYDGTGAAYLGVGDDGIEAFGNNAGGFFSNNVSFAYGYAARGNRGFEGFGPEAGGFFQDTNDGGNAYVGVGARGIEGRGSNMGGYFKDLDSSGEGWAGVSDTGFQGYGNTAGVYGKDNDNGGEGYVGVGANGFQGYGSNMGGFFQDTNGTYANIASDTFAIQSPGVKAFVQNHPTWKDRVIVYTSLEGDEVGTYTRGTARLVGGVARIPLGETFVWVTNPDIGLTAQLTPHGSAVPLAVESMTTKELVVRGPEDGPGDVAFDYIVYGLRIGFEESSVVQEKQRESYIPPMATHRKRYEDHPDLRPFNALERFKAMRASRGEEGRLDLSASQALHDAIGEHEPVIDEVQRRDPEAGTALARMGGSVPAPVQPPAPPRAIGIVTTPAAAPSRAAHSDATAGAVVPRPPLPANSSPVAISGMVESGDVLALDRGASALGAPADLEADPSVLGIVTGEPGATWTEVAPIAVSGVITFCKADATYGAIRPGDLLVASPMRGHAMRAPDDLRQGTVVAKALEQLDTGTGLIRVLVMAR